MTNFLQALSDLEDQHSERLHNLGCKYYDEVVLPFCRKHKLRFFGENEAVFVAENGMEYTTYNIKQAETTFPGIAAILCVLSTYAQENTRFGHYVPDVNEVPQ